MGVRPAGLRRLSAVLAPATVPAVILTGCATTQTTGRAATGDSASACARPGTSTAAVGTTVHCYFTALIASNTGAACSVLSEHVRAAIAASAGNGFDDYDSAIHVPTDGDSGPASTPGSGCSSVAPVMQRALDRLSTTDLQQLRGALTGARIGTARTAGGHASVAVTLTVAGREGTQDVELTQEDGAWKIDSADAFMVNS